MAVRGREEGRKKGEGGKEEKRKGEGNGENNKKKRKREREIRGSDWGRMRMRAGRA